MWTPMKQDVAKQHIKLRDQLRKQFQDAQISDADFLYESEKLFKPITQTTEKALRSYQHDLLLRVRKHQRHQIMRLLMRILGWMSNH